MYLFPHNHWFWAWLKGFSSCTAADLACRLLDFSWDIFPNEKPKFPGHYVSRSTAICALPITVVSYSHAEELEVRKQVIFSDNLERKQILLKVKR